MTLVDTSVWIDHFRSGVAGLIALLDADAVLTHPFVIGEIALGSLRNRSEVLGSLNALPKAQAVTDAEVLDLIASRSLFGTGIGYVDAHLLGSALRSGGGLWTYDRRLFSAAGALGLTARGPH